MEQFGIDAETCKEFIHIQSQSGDNLNEQMTSSLQEWEKTRVNIAVIGETYVGKSTHINAHFGNYAASAGWLINGSLKYANRRLKNVQTSKRYLQKV